MSKVVFSIMFGLHDYVGHIYQYHLSIAKVINQNKWKHRGLVPKDCKIENIPKTWEKVLAKGGWEDKKLKQNFISAWKNFLFLKKFLKKRDRSDVVFIEHFSVFNVFSLILALLVTYPKCSFWILHRFAFPRYGIKTFLYKILHMLVKAKAGKDNLVLLTDSDLLADQQTFLFKQKINVVPIPHTCLSYKKDNNSSQVIDLWWPGGSTRPDKGLRYINLLSEQIANCSKARLLIADSAKSKIKVSDQVHFVKTALDTQHYFMLMQSVDLVLLPYIPDEYKLRTSGIFVEAIVAGAKVVTFKGTWMAYELKKYGLEDFLAFEPGEFCLERIIKISQLQLSDKIKVMKEAYSKFHSEKHYAKVLMSL